MYQRLKLRVTKNQNFAQHLVLNNHNYTNFETNLEVIHVCNNGRYLNGSEEYEIYKHIQEAPNNILNDQLKLNLIKYRNIDTQEK